MASKNRHGKWQGRVKDKFGKERYLGTFPDKAAAEAAEKEMRQRLGKPPLKKTVECEHCGSKYRVVA